MYLSQAALYLTNLVPRTERLAAEIVSVDVMGLMQVCRRALLVNRGGSRTVFLQILVTL